MGCAMSYEKEMVPVGVGSGMPPSPPAMTLQNKPVHAATGIPLPSPSMPIQIAPRVPRAPSPQAQPWIAVLRPTMMPSMDMSRSGGRSEMRSTPHCALCKQPANRACPACKADQDIPTTYYCSSHCRRTHWFEHQAECAIGAGRTALYRAAHIARSLFLDFRKHTSTTKVLNVQNKSGVLSIALDELRAGILYYPFPDNLSLSKEDEATVLSFSACSSSMAYMWDIVSVLLSGRSQDPPR